MDERPVLVTTRFRGVFFGYMSEEPKNETIELKRARNCVYWPASCKGFLGLASAGPLAGSKVGPATDIKLYGITCVAHCTPEAVAKWEEFPWN